MDAATSLFNDIYDQWRRLPDAHQQHPCLREFYVTFLHLEDRLRLLASGNDLEVTIYPEKVFGFDLLTSLQAVEGRPRLMPREDAEAIVAEHTA